VCGLLAVWNVSVVNGNGFSPSTVQTQPPRTDEFVPVSELPPSEQLPAAPLLMTAYIFVWAVFLAYVLSVWRRLARVEREIADVSRRLSDRGRSA
jgi:CcmD family protein